MDIKIHIEIFILLVIASMIVIVPLLMMKNRPSREQILQRKIFSSSLRDIKVDFIIIGGGSAGCVIAARLAEYGFETLLLSSGSNDTLNPIMREQSFYKNIFQIPHLKHYLPVSSSTNLNNRTLTILVWNTLGGNSINAGGMQRMMINDWNYFINATNDQSFDHYHMLKYYQIVENFTSYIPYANLKNHGDNGPIKITQMYDEKVFNLWKNIAKELNETFTDDLSINIDYGFSFESSSFTNGLRSWSGDAYLTLAMNKYPNLKVITGATVIKFNIDDKSKKIENVLFVSKDGLFIAIARKEYILSAGTFYSPHLLMLSGIGDSKILREHEISIKHELKQVGKNLVDNGAIIMEYKVENFSLHSTIPVALINSQIQTNNTNPNIFIITKMNNETQTLRIVIMNTSPKSTIGSVSLFNSNPLISPKINLDYLTHREDLDTFVNAIYYVRKMMSTNVIKNHTKIIEILPGIKETNLFTYVKNTLEPAEHFLGTCSIGRNAEDSVVNNEFKVHGIDNLRIVDASIFPANFTSKSGPLLTIYALAEKAAYIIRQTYS